MPICSSHDDLFHNPPDLSGVIEVIGTHPFACGGYSDIWRGTFNDVGTKRDVAIKIIRVATGKDVGAERLKTNIMPFYGLCWGLLSEPKDGLPAMVYPYCAGGTCKQYLQKNPGVDRMKIVVHGDIKASNVLMQDDGTPMLADFGLSRIVAEMSTGLTTSSCRGSYRWMSPELFGGVDDQIQVLVTTASDVWAFGCLCFEILTDTLPWANIKNDIAVIQNVGSWGQRPPMVPIDESSVIGHILRHCWMYEPSDRPIMCDIEIALRTGDVSRLDQPQCILKPPVQPESPAPAQSGDWNTFISIFSDDPLFGPSETSLLVPSTPSPSTTGATPYMRALTLTPSDSTSLGPERWSKTDRDGRQLRSRTPWQRSGTNTPSSVYTRPSSRLSARHPTPPQNQPYSDQFAQLAPSSPLFRPTEGYVWGQSMRSSSQYALSTLDTDLYRPESGFTIEQ
ncbi:hypothetical protein FRC10_006596 [Ceratobasidium sp. 414]|nr:hypothetical protein FRC10_006596 [Ceratobasidium sp. 414]